MSINVDRVDQVSAILTDGRTLGREVAERWPALGDQVLAGMVECCGRLGLPTDRQTATAYALGVLQAMDVLTPHLDESPRIDGHLRVLFHRAALLHDRKKKAHDRLDH
jgi:hypothetical protein